MTEYMAEETCEDLLKNSHFKDRLFALPANYPNNHNKHTLFSSRLATRLTCFWLCVFNAPCFWTVTFKGPVSRWSNLFHSLVWYFCALFRVNASGSSVRMLRYSKCDLCMGAFICTLLIVDKIVIFIGWD